MSLKDEWLKVKDKAAVVMLSSPLWNGSPVYTHIPEEANGEAIEKVLKFFEDLVNDEPRLFKVSFLDKEGDVLATWGRLPNNEVADEKPEERRRDEKC